MALDPKQRLSEFHRDRPYADEFKNKRPPVLVRPKQDNPIIRILVGGAPDRMFTVPSSDMEIVGTSIRGALELAYDMIRFQGKADVSVVTPLGIYQHQAIVEQFADAEDQGRVA